MNIRPEKKFRTGLNFFSGLIFTTALVVFITAKISFIFTSLSAVQIYDFHILTFALSFFALPDKERISEGPLHRSINLPGKQDLLKKFNRSD